MNLTENTKVRIRVPKHLYESIQEELGKMEEEKHEQTMEEGDINEYVGMSDPQMQIVDILGQLIAGGALSGAILMAAKTLYGYLKNKMSNKAPVAEPAPEEMDEVLELETLMEAIKDLSKKKAEDKKKKEAEAKKKKESEDKKKADEKKKKEAEAKKKAEAAKKK